MIQPKTVHPGQLRAAILCAIFLFLMLVAVIGGFYGFFEMICRLAAWMHR